MKNWGYKLENNTVYSVFDCESNKLDYNEKDMFEGAEVVFEGMSVVITEVVIHCLHFSNKYVIC
jgi:hypothetical protein